MGLTIIDINGRLAAEGTAALICDVCHEPLLGADAGNVVWFRHFRPAAEAAADGVADDHAELTPLHAAHKGACDQRLLDRLHDELGDDWIDQSVDASVFVRQLLGTLEDVFEPRPEFDYVAPRPSRWRVDRSS